MLNDYLTSEEKELHLSALSKTLNGEEYTSEENEVMDKVYDYNEKIVYVYLGDYLKKDCICVKVKNSIALDIITFLEAILTNKHYIISLGNTIPPFYKNITEKETLKELLIDVIPNYKLGEDVYFGY